MNKKAKQAIGVSQIIILLTGIIAIACLIGSIESVSGVEQLTDRSWRCEDGSVVNDPSKCEEDEHSDSQAITSSLAAFSGIDIKKREDTKPANLDDMPEVEEPDKGTGEESSLMGAPGTWGAKQLGTDGTMGLAVGGIIDSAYYGAIAYGFGKMIGDFFGEENVGDAIGTGAAAGAFAYNIMSSENLLGGVDSFKNSWFGQNPGLTSIGIAIVVAAATYEDTKTETITISCDTWQPPEGGHYCQECNRQDLPCSEYQCRSLGLGCELVNKGTEEEKCVWINKDDVNFPQIEPWEDVLTSDYIYIPDNTVSPPDRGVMIVPEDNQDGCVKAFTRLSFGITTDEPSQCKIDYERKEGFDEMRYNFGGKTTLIYNHTQMLNLPGGDNSEEGLTLENNGEYEFFVRCKDANGNKNNANFVISYCVEEGPDTTPPEMVTTDMNNNMPIRYNQSELDITLYTNEPADCKWSHNNQDYQNMEKTMQCSSSVTEMNAQMLYECQGTLDGLKNRQDNNYYFRCRDKPNAPDEDRNTNTQSYKFTVIGTQPLVIDSVGPNETIKDASDPVKVTLTAETRAGYKDGKATCYYSDTGEEGDYVEFYNSNSHEHSQDLHLEEGDYKYWIKCTDLGGNSDTKTTEFRVEADNDAPLITRVFKEDNNLKIMTNEEAECVYDTKDCNYMFEDGISMNDYEGIEHFVEWNIDVIYYIKCKDEFGNRPAPDQCNLIARPMKIEKEN